MLWDLLGDMAQWVRSDYVDPVGKYGTVLAGYCLMCMVTVYSADGS